MAKTSTKSLVIGAKNGDKKSFERLFDMVFPGIYEEVFMRILNEKYSNFIALEILKNIAIEAPKFKWQSQIEFEIYLHKATKKELGKYLNRTGKYRTISKAEFSNSTSIKNVNLKTVKLAKAIIKLSPQEQTIIYAKYIKGHSNSKIAKLLKTNLKSLKKAESKAFEKMLDYLQENALFKTSFKNKKELANYFKTYPFPAVETSKSKNEIKKYSADIFIDSLKNPQKYKFKIKLLPASIATGVVLLAMSIGAYYGYFSRPLNPNLLINRSISYYSNLKKDNSGSFLHVKQDFIDNIDGSSSESSFEYWENLENGDYISQASQNGKNVQKAVKIGDELYDKIKQSTPTITVQNPELSYSSVISDEQIDRLSYAQIDNRLEKAGLSPYFSTLYGTTDFRAYNLTPNQLTLLSDTELNDAFPEKNIPTEAEIRDEEEFYDIAYRIRREQNIGELTALLHSLKSLDGVNLLENTTWNNTPATGLYYANEFFPDSISMILYFDSDTYELIGSKASSKLNSQDTWSESTLSISEIITESPDFDTAGLKRNSYEGFSSEDLSGENRLYRNSELGIEFYHPAEWGELVREVKYYDDRNNDFINLEPSIFFNISLNASSDYGAANEQVPIGSSGYTKKGEWFIDRIDESIRLDDTGVGKEEVNLYGTKYLKIKESGELIDLPEDQGIYTVVINLENSDLFTGMSISYWGSADATDLEILLSSLRTDIN